MGDGRINAFQGFIKPRRIAANLSRDALDPACHYSSPPKNVQKKRPEIYKHFSEHKESTDRLLTDALYNFIIFFTLYI